MMNESQEIATCANDEELTFAYTPEALLTGQQPINTVALAPVVSDKIGPTVPVMRLDHYPVDPESETGEMFPIPQFATDYSAAVDLRSAAEFDVVLAPNESYVFPTGLCYDMMFDKHFAFRVASLVLPRSGMGFKLFTRLANTVGLIDQDYQKEIMVKVRNEGTQNLTIKMGERFCQMMFLPVLVPKFVDVKTFEKQTERGGFGSTGSN